MTASVESRRTRRGPSVADDGHAAIHGREIAALLAVSRAVAESHDSSTVLDVVAREAAEVVGCRSSDIILYVRRGWLQVVGSYGLKPRYRRLYENPPPELMKARGPTTIAVETGKPTLVEDTESDERFAPFRRYSRMQGFRAVANVPLLAGGRSLGALRVYRETPWSWSKTEVEILGMFANHAATAIETARLIEQKNDEVAALSRLVQGLREQGHEHANRLHMIRGLLALGEYAEAERFVASLTSLHSAAYASVTHSIRNATLAGLILAETTIAQQRGIDLRLDRRSRIDRLPAALGEAATVTVVGNLLQNAFDSVVHLAKPRRRVKVGVYSAGEMTRFVVRDWGTGISDEVLTRIFEPGYTTKPDHLGVGLSLVRAAVERAGGEIGFERLPVGTRVEVAIPNA